MAMLSDITLSSTNRPSIVYSATLVKPSSTLRSNAVADISDPETLLISHETQKNGKVNSAIILDYGQIIPCDTTCGTEARFENIRAMFKLTYNPLSGFVAPEEAITALIEQLQAALADDDLMLKFRNREH